MRTLVVAAFGLVVVACSPSSPVLCTGNATRECVGAGACMGHQTCLADGTGFGACDCSGTGGGGGSTGGGSGGGGATGGGGGGGGGGGSMMDAGDDAGTDAGTDAGIDAGIDAGVDAGLDAGVDAGIDAGIDAGFDAGPPMMGELFFLEVATLNPGTSGAVFGQGREAQLSFRPVKAALQEEMPGSALGCKAWELTATEAAATGVDEGAIEVSLDGGSQTCSWSSATGYTCPISSSSHTGGVISAGPMVGLAVLTDTGATFTAANTTNAYLRVQGATNPGNNGLFAIVAMAGANSIVFVNPSYVTETLPGTALHVNYAFAGGTPSAADPGFLADNAQVSVTLTQGGAMDFASFTAATPASVGDDFELSSQTVGTLNTVPRDGSSFTISCDVASCLSGSALLTLLDIVTTDGSTAGQSPFAMPPATTKSVRIQCRGFGANAITVPAAYSALIQSSGATRIQATFSRYNPMIGGPMSVTAGAGHAIRGFTN